MMKHIIKYSMLEQFGRKLQEEEKAHKTIKKYIYDLKQFFQFAGEGTEINKEMVIEYKAKLISCYAATSVNSMLAAMNCFFRKMGWYDCVVKSLKIQKDTFRPKEKELSKEEYCCLLKAAKAKKNKRLYLLMETICATGIRVGELKFITVESLNEQRAVVRSKGKTRCVLLPVQLCRKLRAYCREKEITGGSIFVTRTGTPMDRSNICHEMKRLCEEAGVLKNKVFPHNLRHLFACTYYKMKKDLFHLADILGHSNVNTTRIYTLESGEKQMRQIEALGLVI